jgi:tetratricopeptide (TPR) repeat protein
MEGFMVLRMKTRKLAVIAVLVLGSFAADSVAPSKAELEAMYDKAFRAFDGSNFSEALKNLDAIDARQPDLAESQNLRGVILMREGIYDKAEAALREALRIDPKFWNARFNLAEIPFLEKNWAEARTRFQDLLSSNASELQGEATQLIQYKVLLTYLLEGKENMVDAILAKFELSPDTPAVHYANAAIALQNKNADDAKKWMETAEKNFSPQLNKLFAESLYEVGWLQKQAGQGRAALELTTPAEHAAKMKAFAQSRFEEAQQSLQHHDLATALKYVDDADAATPNQARILNLRGEILMEQKEFGKAEAEFRKALKADPKFREAQYNLAQIPFKQKEYAKARERFEALFDKTPGAGKTQAADLIRFKIYMTLLLEGKESRAQRMMEQFQFTGDTPALYYAQAAWEFKHNNPTKATDWIESARKIYSPALNSAFADAFYDLGWMQSPALAMSPAPATEAAVAMESAPTESSPAIEPSPIPGAAFAKKATSKAESLAAVSPVAGQVQTSSVEHGPGEALAAAGTPVKPEEIPTTPVPSLAPVVETPVAAEALPASSAVPATSVTESKPAEAAAVTAASPATVAANVSATPATALAPEHVQEWKQSAPASAGMKGWLVGGLVLAGIGVLAWFFVLETRRRALHFPGFGRTAPVIGPRIDEVNVPAPAPVQKQMKTPTRLTGGPRQLSLRLKASEPSLRRAVIPSTKPGRAFAPANEPAIEWNGGSEVAAKAPDSEPVFESVGPVVEQGAPPQMAEITPMPVPEPVVMETSTAPIFEETQASAPAPEFGEPAFGGLFAEPAFGEPVFGEPAVAEPAFGEPVFGEPAVAEPAFGEPVFGEPTVAEPAFGEPVFGEPTVAEPAFVAPEYAEPVFARAEEVAEPQAEPIGQGQPIPQLTPVIGSEPYTPETVIEPEPQLAGNGEFGSIVEPPSFDQQAVFTEPVISQPITPVTMPEPIHTPTGPVVRTPSSAQQSGSMQTAVQLTFAFEIASMQLTPTFKMGAVQLRPASKIVTMRLAPSAHPQPAMNLQVNFEISKIQPSGGALGNVRLTPSQQQRPAATGSPSFTVAGLQLVSDFAAAPLQLTPSQQTHTSVLVTAPFQIATVEFSPSFEIASIALSSNSKQVSVQLPGPASSTMEGAPIFEIANLQLTGTGDIGMMQLHLVGHGPKRG